MIMFKKLWVKRYDFFSLRSGQFWLYQANQNNLAQNISGNFWIQFLYQESIWWRQFYLLLFIYVGLGAVQIFDLYIMYLFIGAKVNYISLKNSEQEDSAWLELMIWI